MLKSGFVALLGRPNAGKSTLLNAILHQKVAIVSDKPQTTRNAIRGIMTDVDSQIIFIDTPGVHKPHHQLGQQMNKEAIAHASGVDLVYLIVDAAAEFGGGDEFLLEKVQQLQLPTFLIVNKVDLITKEQLLKFLLAYQQRYQFAEIIPISALKQDNLERLLMVTKQYLPEGVKYYPDDVVCDYPEQFIISELIREKILQLTKDEIPHSVAVVIDKIKKHRGVLYLNATIMVDRDSQKGMVIGKQGALLKQVGTLARTELENILGSKIFLELYVRVEKDWRNKRAKLLQLGYIQMDDDNE
jgi:GTPase